MVDPNQQNQNAGYGFGAPGMGVQDSAMKPMAAHDPNMAQGMPMQM